MKIKFTKEQIKFALDLAKKRHDAKHISFRNKDVAEFNNSNKLNLSSKLNVDNQYMSHYIGIMGEMAWAIANNQQIDENIYSVRDSGQDFDGIEIKTITYFGKGEPELKITKKEYERRKPPKVYVLARISIIRNEVELLGKITRENFDATKVTKQYGPNKPVNYVVPASKMEKI